MGKPARPDLHRSEDRATSCRPSISSKVEKVGGKLVNVDIAKIHNVKDPVKEQMMKEVRRLAPFGASVDAEGEDGHGVQIHPRDARFLPLCGGGSSAGLGK